MEALLINLMDVLSLVLTRQMSMEFEDKVALEEAFKFAFKEFLSTDLVGGIGNQISVFADLQITLKVPLSRFRDRLLHFFSVDHDGNLVLFDGATCSHLIVTDTPNDVLNQETMFETQLRAATGQAGPMNVLGFRYGSNVYVFYKSFSLMNWSGWMPDSAVGACAL